MKLTADNDALAQDKILILYLLDKLNKPITANELLKIIVTIKDINYFYIQQFLLDLKNLNYIISYEKNNSTLYEITQEGIYNLKLLQDLLPGIIKLKIDTKAKEIFEEVQNEFSVSAEYLPEGNNKFIVKCKIIENHTSLLELSVFTGSSNEAKKIAENWKENCTKLYPQIINILTKKCD